MEFSILGPLEVRSYGVLLTLAAPMQRALLGHLLLAAGGSLSMAELTERLWPGKRPRCPKNAIQLLVLRLRRTLDEFPSGVRIESVPGGYRIELGDAVLDSTTFTELVERADAERDRGDADTERELLSAALELWRGPVLGDPTVGWHGSPEANGLVALRTAVIERLATVDLDCGRPEHAIALLRASLPDNPASDQLRYLLVLALYRSGRRAEALAACAEACRYLADELGLDPGQKLRRLQETIQYERDLPKPEHERTGQGSRPSRQASPAVLPTRVAGFVGRTRELDAISNRTAMDTIAGTAICGISGLPGSGRSALALQVAHRLRKDFPDGQLYFDFDADPSASTAQVLTGFLRLLGIDDDAIPVDPAARAGLFRSCTSGRRILILLDGVDDSAQVRTLLPGDGHSAVVLTCRAALLDLDGACWFGLDVLDRVDATALLGSLIGRRRLSSERAAATRIVEYCGHLPLALRVVGARLSTRPDWTLQQMVTLLADEDTRLDRLELGDLSVGRAIGDSCGRCTDEQQLALRTVAGSELGEVTMCAVAAALGTDSATTAELLDALVDCHLLTLVTVRDGGPRYRLPMLVRLHVRREIEQERQAELARATSRRPRLLRPGQTTDDVEQPDADETATVTDAPGTIPASAG